MPRIIDRLTGFFATRRVSAPAPRAHVLNPAIRPDRLAPADPGSAAQLEEQLLCWLLDAPPARLLGPMRAEEALSAEIGRRLDTGELDELPRQPGSLPTLIRALSSEHTDRSAMTRLILEDPALTDQLLQVANSPLFRAGDQGIGSVDQAVFKLGISGIRSAIATCVMRPVAAARDRDEAQFNKRAWLWAQACGRASELVAGIRGQETGSFFLLGLLPSMAYITLHREVTRINRTQPIPSPGRQADTCAVLRRFEWRTVQLIATEWGLPASLHASLLSAERPASGESNTPLNDGLILGTQEVLRQAQQQGLSEDELRSLLSLDEAQFQQTSSNTCR